MWETLLDYLLVNTFQSMWEWWRWITNYSRSLWRVFIQIRSLPELQEWQHHGNGWIPLLARSARQQSHVGSPTRLHVPSSDIPGPPFSSRKGVDHAFICRTNRPYMSISTCYKCLTMLISCHRPCQRTLQNWGIPFKWHPFCTLTMVSRISNHDVGQRY